MSESMASIPCPRCGEALPAEDAIVCPACEAILRPDPDLAETHLETMRRRNLLLLTIGTIVIFALTLQFNPRLPLIPLGLAAIYVLAFKFSERRTSNLMGLFALSIVAWLGFCALIIGILFVGCLVLVKMS